MGCADSPRDRRSFLGLLGLGLTIAASGCAGTSPAAPGSPAGDAVAGPGVDPAQPDPAGTAAESTVLSAGPPGTRRIALTIDDGYCADCVAGYVEFARRTGIHLTFSPNGLYNHAWAPHAPVLAPLIAAGQVQIINHTYSHSWLTTLPAGRIRDELERNEDWIQRTFATSTRPYYRPPYGAHNPAVDHTAAQLGLDRVVLWNGSFGDSRQLSPPALLEQARRYLQPGTILLGHANHRTVLGLFDQITQLLRERNLQPVTLDELFDTHRP